MADFVLKSNYYEFSGQTKQLISGTAIGNKFGSPYTCFFMDKIETAFLETKEFQSLVWFRYIDDIFFTWTHGGQKLWTFLRSLNKFHTDMKFIYESSKESMAFLRHDLQVSIKSSKIIADLYRKSTDCHQYLHYLSPHQNHTKRFVARLYALAGCALMRKTL